MVGTWTRSIPTWFFMPSRAQLGLPFVLLPTLTVLTRGRVGTFFQLVDKNGVHTRGLKKRETSQWKSSEPSCGNPLPWGVDRPIFQGAHHRKSVGTFPILD
jgi:hypothetical protein